MKGLLASTSITELADELKYRYHILTPNMNGCNFLGFNSRDLMTTADICYYGCSITFGIGVDNANRWTNIIDNHKNYISNNFGINGIGIDEIASIFASTTKFVKMKKALFFLPHSSRQTIPVAEAPGGFIYGNMHPNYEQTLYGWPQAQEIAKVWYRLPDAYYTDRARIAINLISYIAELNNIEIYFSSWNQEVYDLLPSNKTKNYHISDRLGYDNRHPGPVVHANIANDFMELL